jgi:predicted O-linked N-acetylglucosamine transferase (SPINDLY family)
MVERLIDLGQYDEAETALAGADHDFDSLFLAAKLAGLRKDHSRAVALLESLCLQGDDRLETIFTLAVEYGECARYLDGFRCIESLLPSFPGLPLLYRWKAAFLRNLDRLDEASAALGKALELQPDYSEALISLADVCFLQLRVEEAQHCLETLLEKNPDHATVLNDLARIYRIQGKVSRAIELFERALEHDPGNRSLASNYLLALLYSEQLTPEFVASEHVRLADRLYPLTGKTVQTMPVSAADTRIRIGYVSGDFRTHAVSFFIEPVLTHHDKTHFEVVCYSNTDRADATTDRLKELGVAWRDIYGVSAHQAAAMVQADRIDILVDLAGHTAGNRLDLFALKPSPIQVSWIGYPHSSGLPQMDYAISDTSCDPPEAEHLYREQIWRLPRVFCCYYPPMEFPVVSELPCLQTGRVIFGCYNNFAKINDTIIELWCRILLSVPGSRICLKSASLGGATLSSEVLLRFEKYGIAADRIVLYGFVDSPGEHLAHYAEIDIALDTFPYHGTTTTCEAFWMGVPVITLAGRSHVSRVGVSLLSAVGLTRFVAHSPGQYVELAVALAYDRLQLHELRKNLRTMFAQSPVMDAVGVTRELEVIYRGMVKAN